MKKTLSTLLLALLAWLAPAAASAATACLVLSRQIPPYAEAAKGFRAGFTGKVVEFDMGGDAVGGMAILPKIAEANCDVIAALGSPAIKFLKIRITDKPLVYAMVLNPAAEGVSGANITGVHLEPAPQTVLAGLKRIIPNAKRVGVLYSPAVSGSYIEAARKAAAGLGLSLTAAVAPTAGDAVRALDALASQADVLWMIPDAVTSSDSVFREMLRISLQKGVPIFALAQKNVSDGALAALATDYLTNGLQAGQIASRIAGGQAPSSIPDEYARKVGWFVNLKTAERLGIKILQDIEKEAVEAYR
jgi:putative tryptophan/tyrosine transport system substrate-binding protein